MTDDSPQWVTITAVDNGYKVKAGSYDADGNPETLRVVFEEPEHYCSDAERDAKTIEKLLWWLADYFGASGCKHDTHRLSISVDKNAEGY